MVTAIEEIDVIVGQFLDYARSGDGEAATSGNLGTLLHTIVGEFAAQGHVFEVEIAELPPIAFRPTALRRLITNLMHNAVRHGSDAGRALCVRREGNSVVVRVLDRGPGIPADQMESALRPFARLDAAKRKPGSGLGLAIAERIANCMVGTCSCCPVTAAAWKSG
jgi:two-component system, OmpR family, osmolarity sensor histidine kinase EnvZ